MNKRAVVKELQPEWKDNSTRQLLEASASLDQSKRFAEPEGNHEGWWSDEADEAINFVKNLANLPDDWNSYGATAPSPEVIRLCWLSIAVLDKYSIGSDNIIATPSTSIDIEFTYKGYKLEIAIDTDDWEVIETDKHGNEEIYTLPGEVESIDRLVEGIKQRTS